MVSQFFNSFNNILGSLALVDLQSYKSAYPIKSRSLAYYGALCFYCSLLNSLIFIYSKITQQTRYEHPCAAHYNMRLLTSVY